MGACVCNGGTFITAGVAERIGNCTQLSLGLGGGVAANALATGWTLGVAVGVLWALLVLGVVGTAGVGIGVCVGAGVTEAAVAVSEGAGAGVRGRGGKRVQLSMSVTGPWAKLGNDKLAEMAKARAVLAP